MKYWAEDIRKVAELMEKELTILSEKDLRNKIYVIRGVQVMLDSDLAEIYGYEVRALNQQVKRNISRFPDDFMFQLTREELDFVKSQIVISRNLNYFKGQEGGARKLPFAFTEQGVYMLATVLHGKLAEQQSIFIMRAFKAMKYYLHENASLLPLDEIKLLKQSVLTLTEKQNKTDKEIIKIYESIDKLNENFVQQKNIKDIVIFKGQKFEADVAYSDIYKLAQKTIYIIDDYVNIKTLNLLKQKTQNTNVILFTENKRGKNGVLTKSEVDDFNNQFPDLVIKPNPDSHDRFIIIDYRTSNEQVFHCGASSKDAGNKICTINKIENTSLIYPIIDRYLLQKDKIL